MIRWDQARKDELALRWHAGETMTQIAKAMGTTRSAISGASNRQSLQFHGGDPQPIAPGSRPDVFATTRFPSKVQAPGRHGVLKPGSYQRKLGPVVLKGLWKGMPLYSLSLEERATCPRACQQWLSCYGNASINSVRYRHGPGLERAIIEDLAALENQYPRGFVVRTHQLGDYHSVEYVEFWREMLATHPALHIFGYTAWQPDTPIGAAIADLRRFDWYRFAVRTSGAESGPRTLVVKTPSDVAPGAVHCPAQQRTRRPVSCSSCGLCWSPTIRDKPIVFTEH